MPGTQHPLITREHAPPKGTISLIKTHSLTYQNPVPIHLSLQSACGKQVAETFLSDSPMPSPEQVLSTYLLSE